MFAAAAVCLSSTAACSGQECRAGWGLGRVWAEIKLLGEVWIRGIKLFCWLQVVFSQSTSMVFLHGTLYTTMWSGRHHSPHPPEGSHFIISRVREIFNVEGLDQVVDRVTFIRKEVVIKPLENFIQS